jgi:two-component system response regulator FlrC
MPMSASHLPISALWLDPFRPLSAANAQALAGAGLVVTTVSTLDALQEALADEEAAYAMLVLGLGGDTSLLEDGSALVKASRQSLPLVCRTERRHLEAAIAAIHQGACHALAADDWSTAAWTQTINRARAASQAAKTIAVNTAAHAVVNAATHNTQSPTHAPAQEPVRSVVYVDPISRNLLALAHRVALANVAVLIEGPTGSGKEVLSRVLHEASASANGPFIGFNCAAMPEHMIEDMLFGHDKGAFTGAVKDHRGLFEQAQGGTIFLDEIGELPLTLQAKLLRVLQERTLVRLGGERTISLDVRVVAATNKNLRESIAQREFREDLYFRLSTFKLRVPALAERPGDILPIVARMLGRHGRNGQSWSVSPAAQTALLAYPWPGNVRELENVVQRAMVLCADQQIDTQHLMFDDMSVESLLASGYQAAATPTPAAPPAVDLQLAQGVPANIAELLAMVQEDDNADMPLQAAVKHNEHTLIRAALETSRSRIEAAEKLGISPRTLRYKLARLRDSSLSQLANA